MVIYHIQVEVSLLNAIPIRERSYQKVTGFADLGEYDVT